MRARLKEYLFKFLERFAPKQDSFGNVVTKPKVELKVRIYRHNENRWEDVKVR